MKRIAFVLALALLGSAAMFADENVLIDFTKLAADYPAQSAAGTTPSQNSATLTDFSVAAGSSFTDVDKAKMVISLALQQWEVRLNSSANAVANSQFSYTKPAPVAKDSNNAKKGDQLLGIRAHFPTEPFNSFIDVKPPFRNNHSMKGLHGSPLRALVASRSVSGLLAAESLDWRWKQYRAR